MYFPKLNAPRQSRVTVNRFPGLDRRPRGQAGSFREMENLCAQGYPTLTVRRPRGIAGSVTAPGGLTAKDGLIWVDGHTLWSSWIRSRENTAQADPKRLKIQEKEM